MLNLEKFLTNMVDVLSHLTSWSMFLPRPICMNKYLLEDVNILNIDFPKKNILNIDISYLTRLI